MSKPVEVGNLKVGNYVVIDGEPCRIVDYEKSKPGKHGAAKARIIAVSALTGQKKSIVSPVSAKIEVPIIDKKTGQVISVTGNILQLMDLETYETFDTEVPEDEELARKMSSGIEVEYWNMLGKIKIVRIKG